MKKFSKITGQKVGESPKVEALKLSDEDLFKTKVLNLMEQLLSIRTYGPVDRYLRAGSIKISGKELLAEAIVSLMSDKSLKEQSKLLESLKSSVNDWEVIDSRIDEVNNKLSESKENNKTLTHRRRLISIYNNYNGDEEMILNIVEKSSSKIKLAEVAHNRAVTAEYMAVEGKYPKELFNKISEKYKARFQELSK